ncbi:hypothetical protein IW261DRAFT_1431750, partial [Armillaria novae-zelandiae]
NLTQHLRKRKTDRRSIPFFKSCTVLIHRNDTRTLRGLTLLHSEHSSWSGCIQRLEDSGIDGAVVAEFKAFIQAGCMGEIREDSPPSTPSSVSSQEENEKPSNTCGPRCGVGSSGLLKESLVVGGQNCRVMTTECSLCAQFLQSHAVIVHD